LKLIALLSPYLGALILTLIVEGILCWLFLKNTLWIKFTCLVNLFTNPLVNFIYTMTYFALATHSLLDIAPWFLFLLELIVWLSEAWLFYRFDNTKETSNSEQKKPVSTIYKALLFSLILNVASYGTGLLLQL